MSVIAYDHSRKHPFEKHLYLRASATFMAAHWTIMADVAAVAMTNPYLENAQPQYQVRKGYENILKAFFIF
jgi:hypothetical protein